MYTKSSCLGSQKHFCKSTVHPVNAMYVFTGATRPQYAPEPLDVGWLLQADLGLPNGTKESVTTTGPLDEGEFLFCSGTWIFYELVLASC